MEYIFTNYSFLFSHNDDSINIYSLVILILCAREGIQAKGGPLETPPPTANLLPL